MLMNPNWTGIWKQNIFYFLNLNYYFLVGSESHNTKITLKEPAQCCTVFGDFLAYLYTGKLNME